MRDRRLVHRLRRGDIDALQQIYHRYKEDLLFDPNIPVDYQLLHLESAAGKGAAWLGAGALPVMGFVAYRRRHPRGHGVSGIPNE